MPAPKGTFTTYDKAKPKAKPVKAAAIERNFEPSTIAPLRLEDRKSLEVLCGRDPGPVQGVVGAKIEADVVVMQRAPSRLLPAEFPQVCIKLGDHWYEAMRLRDADPGFVALRKAGKLTAFPLPKVEEKPKEPVEPQRFPQYEARLKRRDRKIEEAKARKQTRTVA